MIVYTAFVRPRRLKLRLLIAALAIAAVVGAFVLFVMDSPPVWYQPPDVRDAQVLKDAEEVEYRLIEEAHRLRSPDEPFTVRLREQHANAWLAARLPKWVEFEHGLEWPARLGVPQIRMGREGIEMAGSVRTRLGRRYVVLRLVPRVQDGQLVLTATHTSVGRMNAGAIGPERIVSMLGPERVAKLSEHEVAAKLIDAMGGGAAFEPVLKLADGRRIALASISLGEGFLDVTVRALEDER